MDYDSGSALISLIGILAGAVFALYFGMEVVWPAISKFRKSSSDIASDRAGELLDQHLRAEQALNQVQRDPSLRAPRLRMLRVGRADGLITCLFVNEGGTASRLEVAPIGPFQASITPHDALHHGDTGRVDLLADGPLSLLQFRILYTDSYSHRTARLYAYSETEDRFQEI